MSATKERPILFSGAMVRAILEGRKTVTRRPVKRLALQWLDDGFEPSFVSDPDNAMCPYGQPGDRLWVRESTEVFVSPCGSAELARYCADKTTVLLSGCTDPEFEGSVAHWSYPRNVRPSIHMKREQARILLEITSIRVERLQDISEEQAEAEGVDFLRHAPEADETLTAKQLFECLWSGINGDASWKANPWVWVVEFKKVHQP